MFIGFWSSRSNQICVTRARSCEALPSISLCCCDILAVHSLLRSNVMHRRCLTQTPSPRRSIWQLQQRQLRQISRSAKQRGRSLPPVVLCIRTCITFLDCDYSIIIITRFSCQRGASCRQPAGEGCKIPAPCWTRHIRARPFQPWARRSICIPPPCQPGPACEAIVSHMMMFTSHVMRLQGCSGSR